MTRLEYELLREEMPHLRLPHYHSLDLHSFDLLLKLDRQTLISRRGARLLNGSVPIPFEDATFHKSLS